MAKPLLRADRDFYSTDVAPAADTVAEDRQVGTSGARVQAKRAQAGHGRVMHCTASHLLRSSWKGVRLWRRPRTSARGTRHADPARPTCSGPACWPCSSSSTPTPTTTSRAGSDLTRKRASASPSRRKGSPAVKVKLLAKRARVGEPHSGG